LLGKTISRSVISILLVVRSPCANAVVERQGRVRFIAIVAKISAESETDRSLVGLRFSSLVICLAGIENGGTSLCRGKREQIRVSLKLQS
jgi:hypothetical protein